MDGRLSPEQRLAALDELPGAELDVLVVGGGVVGAGTALDAVTRGLSVGLIEMDDWGSGSSSRSSMVIDGGLRQLDALQLSGLKAGLRERALLVDRIAPHLVRRVPFLFPLHHTGWDRVSLGARLTFLELLGHAVAPAPGMPSHRHLSHRSVRRIAPGLGPDLVGAVQYYGAQVDDARYVVNLVRTAASFGTLVASRVRAESLVRTGDRVSGVRACDVETGEQLQIRAKVVVAATGAADTGPDHWGLTAAGPSQLALTKGVHLVVPRDRIRSSTGLVRRRRASVLLVMPWGRHWIVGRTRSPGQADGGRPVPSAEEIDELLRDANEVLASPLTRDDIQGSYAGVWPQLPSPPGPRGVRPAEEHRVEAPAEGLVLIRGGSFSRYRRMAADAVDAAAESIGGLVAESITEAVPLVGADGYRARWNQRHLLARRAGLHVARVEHLLNRYGALADQLLDLVRDDPLLGLPLDGAPDYLAAEARYAVSHEGAIHLADVLERRTRISIENSDGGVAAAGAVAELVTGPMGWTGQTRDREVGGYVERVAADHIWRQPETINSRVE